MASISPSSEPLAVIQRQLEIYNKRDVEEFMTLFAEDCALLDLQTGTELARGKDSIRERYTKRFASPGLKCILHARMAIGRVVVDKELITGLPDGKEANCMAVYQVNEQGLIFRVRSASSYHVTCASASIVCVTCTHTLLNRCNLCGRTSCASPSAADHLQLDGCVCV